MRKRRRAPGASRERLKLWYASGLFPSSGVSNSNIRGPHERRTGIRDSCGGGSSSWSPGGSSVSRPALSKLSVACPCPGSREDTNTYCVEFCLAVRSLSSGFRRQCARTTSNKDRGPRSVKSAYPVNNSKAADDKAVDQVVADTWLGPSPPLNAHPSSEDGSQESANAPFKTEGCVGSSELMVKLHKYYVQSNRNAGREGVEPR